MDYPELQRELQQKAYELGKSWTWTNIGQQYTCFISKILNATYPQDESDVQYAKL